MMQRGGLRWRVSLLFVLRLVKRDGFVKLIQDTLMPIYLDVKEFKGPRLALVKY